MLRPTVDVQHQCIDPLNQCEAQWFNQGKLEAVPGLLSILTAAVQHIKHFATNSVEEHRQMQREGSASVDGSTLPRGFTLQKADVACFNAARRALSMLESLGMPCEQEPIISRADALYVSSRRVTSQHPAAALALHNRQKQRSKKNLKKMVGDLADKFKAKVRGRPGSVASEMTFSRETSMAPSQDGPRPSSFFRTTTPRMSEGAAVEARNAREERWNNFLVGFTSMRPGSSAELQQYLMTLVLTSSPLGSRAPSTIASDAPSSSCTPSSPSVRPNGTVPASFSELLQEIRHVHEKTDEKLQEADIEMLADQVVVHFFTPDASVDPTGLGFSTDNVLRAVYSSISAAIFSSYAKRYAREDEAFGVNAAATAPPAPSPASPRGTPPSRRQCLLFAAAACLEELDYSAPEYGPISRRLVSAVGYTADACNTDDATGVAADGLLPVLLQVVATARPQCLFAKTMMVIDLMPPEKRRGMDSYALTSVVAAVQHISEFGVPSHMTSAVNSPTSASAPTMTPLSPAASPEPRVNSGTLQGIGPCNGDGVEEVAAVVPHESPNSNESVVNSEGAVCSQNSPPDSTTAERCEELSAAN